MSLFPFKRSQLVLVFVKVQVVVVVSTIQTIGRYPSDRVSFFLHLLLASLEDEALEGQRKVDTAPLPSPFACDAEQDHGGANS